MTMIYVCLVLIMVELSMSKHLGWSVLHSFWWNLTCFLAWIYLTWSWSLVLINLEMGATSISLLMHRGLHLIGSHLSSVDRSNMAMALLLLFRSRTRSIVSWILARRSCCFLLSIATHIILAVSTLIVFAISSGFWSTSTHTQILLLLNAALITRNICRLRLILIFLQELLIVTWRITSSIQLLLVPSLLLLTWIMRLHLCLVTRSKRMLWRYSSGRCFNHTTTWLLFNY